MVTRSNISSGMAMACFTCLLGGTLLFTPDIFVSRYTTSPAIWLQCGLGTWLLMYLLFKKGDMKLPSPGYAALVLAWACYRLARGNWSFETLVNLLTGITAFFLFYSLWKTIPAKHVMFGVFACLGIVLSAWGILQYAGWVPKTYSAFTMTGPFNNPAGITAALALLYPFSFYFCCKWKGKARWASIFFSLLLAGAVILSGARAAMLAITAAALLFAVHLLKKRKGIKLSFLHHGAIALAFTLLLGGLYLMKKDSADGRLLIWHCSGQLVKQAPLFGHGNNGFKARYMTGQANYFSRHPGSKYAMLADNTGHPFNEFIKEVVEHGIAGLLLSAILVAVPLYQSRKKRSLEMIIARLALLSVGICSFFSYPLDYPFLLLMVIVLMAFVSASVKGRGAVVPVLLPVRATFAACSLIILTATGYQVYCERKWMSIAHESLAGHTKKMLPEYNNLYKNTYLGKNSLFLYNYGAELNHIGMYKGSNQALLLCSKQMNDYDVQMLLGNNYERLDNRELAEKHYSLAHEMIPVRFAPLYALAKHYESTGQNKKARAVAEEIVNKEVKVPSLDITRVKEEMNRLISTMAEKEACPLESGM